MPVRHKLKKLVNKEGASSEFHLSLDRNIDRLIMAHRFYLSR